MSTLSTIAVIAGAAIVGVLVYKKFVQPVADITGAVKSGADWIGSNVWAPINSTLFGR